MMDDTPNPDRRTPVTIRDVAERAGVVVSTVSKVLNNSGAVSKATREKVEAAARELRFRPNNLARSLHTGLSSSIGLISTDAFGRFTMPIMEGLEAYLSERDMGVFMSNATDDPERERMHIEQLLTKQVDGIIVTFAPCRSPPGHGSAGSEHPGDLRLLARQ